ncbi:MAG: hypothetical protein DRJ65_00120 [Acidobacteria bacterium]|nr:MAG: hypothetical protein DRJ65_00120 [Acidobacteriota bacterium]
MSIERIFPTQICFEDGLLISTEQPDAIKNRSPFGPPVTMRYAERVTRAYTGRLSDITAGHSNFKRLESFLEQVPPIVGVFWLREIISGEHRKLRCHQRGDGSRTTFVAPVCTGGTVDAVFVNDVPVSGGDYTVIQTANLIPNDNSCNGDGDSDVVPAGVTSPSSDPISVSRTLPHIGYTSFLAEPASAKVNVSVRSAGVAASAGSEYTAGVSVLVEPGNYDLDIEWYNGASPLTPSTDNTVVLAAGWLHLTLTDDAPANTTICYVTLTRKHSSGTPLYVGGFQLSDGDLDELFLPDSAPVVVTFDTAPADRAEVSFSVTGNRMTKCMLSKKVASWKQYDVGHTLPERLTATEVRQ